MKKDISFESAIEELESEVKKLEEGNLSLDEALESYEKAIGLVKICNEKLESADRKVRVFVENSDSEMSLKDFDGKIDET